MNTQNDFATSNAPNPDDTSEVELDLSRNETAVESLSPDDSARAEEVISPLRSFRAKTEKQHMFNALWTLQVHWRLTYTCQVCPPLIENVNAKDKKYKKGFMKYSSASGSSSLRHHVEDHHKTPHLNVKKCLC